MKKGQAVKYTLSFLLAAVLLYFAFRGVDWKAFLEGLLHTRWFYVGLIFVSVFLAVFFRMLRWRDMIIPVDPAITAKKTWDAANVGNFLNVVLPGAGEFARCGLISAKGGAGYEKVFGTIVMERVWDIIAILALFIIALASKWSFFGGFFQEQVVAPLAGRFKLNLWIILLALFMLLAVGIFIMWKLRTRSRFCASAVEKVRGLWQGFGSFLKMKRKLLFLLYTVCIWLSYILMCYFAVLAVPGLEHMTFVDALFISALGNLASVIPVPGGIGAYHYLVALTMSSLYAVSWEMGILFATICHEAHSILLIVLGIISYVDISLKSKYSIKQ
ncbi:MAG: flippase-like domain-containing protein [Bacteroidales bacterium]|nr:flippase-like domain-containing protein [Bacteroidales bacterium]